MPTCLARLAVLLLLHPGTSAQVQLCGDCSTDGHVSIVDALLAAQHSVAAVTLTSPAFDLCNVEGIPGGSGVPGAVVDILDALEIAQAAAGVAVLDCSLRQLTRLVALGPGSSLGAGPNLVGGGPDQLDPCTYDIDYTFSLGAPSRGELTETISFGEGGNPLVFDRDGQSAQLVVEATFSGPGPVLVDVSAAATPDGTTSYVVTPGPGGPYALVAADGLVTSRLVGTHGMSGCDLVTVTFTPSGTGLSGGSGGLPLSTTFAACIDYYGWDTYSRDVLDLMAPGDLDATMPGTPSGASPPGPGGRVGMILVGKGNPTDVLSVFDLHIQWQPACLEPDSFVGMHGVTGCWSPPTLQPWTLTPHPWLGGAPIFLVNAFRVGGLSLGAAGVETESLFSVTWSRVGSGDTTLVTTVHEFADEFASTIPGSYPLPARSPGCSAGFTLP